MFARISPFFVNVFSKYRCGFRKDKVFGLLKRNLWKAFDSLDHKLLTVKLDAYSFNLPALCLIHEYLSNGKQQQQKN